MRMDGRWARERFVSERVARLATADPQGRPHLVPIVYAVLGEVICSVVDDKPKSTRKLRRLDNIAQNPLVSVLVDRYCADWDQLWWARADGTARIVDLDTPQARPALIELASRYPQYRHASPPGPMLAIDVTHWSGWTANGQTPSPGSP